MSELFTFHEPLWGLMLTLLVGFAIVLAWVPWRLDVSLQARARPPASFIAAGGFSLGILALAAAGGTGAPVRLTVRFGPFARSMPLPASERAVEAVQRAVRPGRSRKDESRNRSWLDPLDAVLQLVEERRHFRLRYLVVEVGYSFRDPVLTGTWVGALAALTAVLPQRVVVRQHPRWTFEDGFELEVAGRALLRPIPVLLELTIYVVRAYLRGKFRERRGETTSEVR